MLLQNLKSKQKPASPQPGSPSSTVPPPPPLTDSKPQEIVSPAEKTEEIQPNAKDATESVQDAKNIITELKIKVANVNKTVLDFEMQNIMGELSDADFKTKKARLQSVKERLEQQIKDLQ